MEDVVEDLPAEDLSWLDMLCGLCPVLLGSPPWDARTVSSRSGGIRTSRTSDIELGEWVSFLDFPSLSSSRLTASAIPLLLSFSNCFEVSFFIGFLIVLENLRLHFSF